MNVIGRLRKEIPRDVFDYRQLVSALANYRKPRDKIRQLIAHGEVVRIRKGLYTFGEVYRREPVCREMLANLIHGPSYVSLDFALAHHGLIPERVETVTSVATGRTRTFETPFGNFTYRQLTLPRYAVGALLEETASASFLIASPEKALVDRVWADKRFDGTRLSTFGPYLEEDLRIEPNVLAALDAQRLETIEKAYDSRKIHNLCHHLRSRRESSDA